MSYQQSYSYSSAERPSIGYTHSSGGWVESGLDRQLAELADTIQDVQQITQVINVNNNTTINIGSATATTTNINTNNVTIGTTQAGGDPVPSSTVVINSEHLALGRYTLIHRANEEMATISSTGSDAGLVANVRKLNSPDFHVKHPGLGFNGTTGEVELDEELGLVNGQFVLVKGSAENDQVYKVLSHNSYVLTIDSEPAPYFRSVFTTEASRADIRIFALEINILKMDSDPTWPLKIGLGDQGTVTELEVVYNTSAPNFTTVELTADADQAKLYNTTISAPGVIARTHEIIQTDADDQFVLADASQYLKNKTLDDTTCQVANSSDNTTTLAFDVTGVPNTELVLQTAQTTSHTLSFPNLGTIGGAGATLQDTLVAEQTTQTLKNKTITDGATNHVAAEYLLTTTNGLINVKAVGPTVGQALIADTTSSAKWQDLPASSTWELAAGANIKLKDNAGNVIPKVGTSDSISGVIVNDYTPWTLTTGSGLKYETGTTAGGAANDSRTISLDYTPFTVTAGSGLTGGTGGGASNTNITLSVNRDMDDPNSNPDAPSGATPPAPSSFGTTINLTVPINVSFAIAGALAVSGMAVGVGGAFAFVGGSRTTGFDQNGLWGDNIYDLSSTSTLTTAHSGGHISVHTGELETKYDMRVDRDLYADILKGNTSTNVAIGDSGSGTTTINSPTLVTNDTTTNGTLTVTNGTNSTTISGDTITTSNLAVTNLNIVGNTSYIESTNVMAKDRFIYLGQGQPATAQSSGTINQVGVVASYDLEGVFAPGLAGVSQPMVGTVVASGLSAGDFITVSGSQYNDGLYEVHSHAGNLLQIRGVGSVDISTLSDELAVRDFVNEPCSTAIPPKANKVTIVVSKHTPTSSSLATTSTTAGLVFKDVATEDNYMQLKNKEILNCSIATDTIFTSSGSLTMPPDSGYLVSDSAAQTLTNKVLIDTNTAVANLSDDTKRVMFSCASIGTGNTRTLTIPDKDGTIACLDDLTSYVPSPNFTNEYLAMNYGNNNVRPSVLYWYLVEGTSYITDHVYFYGTYFQIRCTTNPPTWWADQWLYLRLSSDGVTNLRSGYYYCNSVSGNLIKIMYASYPDFQTSVFSTSDGILSGTIRNVNFRSLSAGSSNMDSDASRLYYRNTYLSQKKTIAWLDDIPAATSSFVDSSFEIKNSVTATNKVAFSLASVVGTKTLTVPNADGTIALTSNIPTISGTANRVTVSGSSTLTLSTPQDLHTAASVIFGSAKLGGHTSGSPILAGSLLLSGTDSNATTGAHLLSYTSVDNYPVTQLLNYSHGNAALVFDGYYDGAWKHSRGINKPAYALYNLADGLYLTHATSSGVGSALTWNTALSLDSTGNIKIPKLTLADSTDTTKTANFVLSGISTGTNRTFTLPNASGTIALTSTLPTTFNDSTFQIYDNLDSTKRVSFDVAGITTGTTQSFAFPNTTGTLATTDMIPSLPYTTSAVAATGATTRTFYVSLQRVGTFIIGTISDIASGNSSNNFITLTSAIPAGYIPTNILNQNPAFSGVATINGVLTQVTAYINNVGTITIYRGLSSTFASATPLSGIYIPFSYYSV